MPKASGAFGLGGGVLVMVGTVARERKDTFLQKLGLSATEAQIANAAARGLSVAELAQERMIAVDTVRSHLKAVYGKLAVHSQRELAARLRPIL